MYSLSEQVLKNLPGIRQIVVGINDIKHLVRLHMVMLLVTKMLQQHMQRRKGRHSAHLLTAHDWQVFPRKRVQILQEIPTPKNKILTFFLYYKVQNV